ncbi:MAG: ribosome small subunit-dependent GTPase A [Gammaproteobacteria bacterium]|nr:ribosome small subunit-dependent GTPase A [Gammaproteobacteria bacterium]
MGTEFTAQVIASHGRHATVCADGCSTPARPFGRRLALVCGDRVRCRRDDRHDEVHVLERLPRQTALHRTNARGESEVIAANLDLLAVVIAPRPVADFFLVDRYLAAAASAGLEALIVLNKCDLEIPAGWHTELAALARCGYRTIESSARDGTGLDALRDAFAGHTAALTGQSGVGKSSLVAGLVPGAAVETGELLREGGGRHTTTTSRLYPLAGGGQLIDSPGVRDFAPAIERLDRKTLGFTDVARFATGCRFLDCRHLREPDCAVREAAERATMHPRRYESYRRLRHLYDELRAAQGPAARR